MLASLLHLAFSAIGYSTACAPLGNAPPPPFMALPPLGVSPSTLPARSPAEPQSLTFDDYQVEPHQSSFVQRDSAITNLEKKSRFQVSFFDLFRPLTLPDYKKPGSSQKTTQEVSLDVEVSPPVHWTYCDPICGVGDQAVDPENAYDNAMEDVREAVHNACGASSISCDEKSLIFEYSPKSVLVEDFGPYFDIEGNRYRLSGNTVAFRINSEKPGNVISFTEKLKLKYRLKEAISNVQERQMKQQMVDFLSARKGVQVQTAFADL